MRLLTDIAIEHTYRGKHSAAPQTFTLHPVQNAGGMYSVIGTLNHGTKVRKVTLYLTVQELAELYARNLHVSLNLRLRVGPSGSEYPVPNPGKSVPSRCVVEGSDFDRMVQAVDTSNDVSRGLKAQLAQLTNH